MKNMETIQEVLETATKDAEKFMNGNNAAGTRLRKAMQEIKALAQEIRLEVQTIKNN